MERLTESQLKSQGFKCTDASERTEQWVRKISKTQFEVYERYANVFNEIDLSEFSEEELDSEVNGYYSSLNEIREQYGEDSNQIIAECISEQMV